MNGYFDQLQTFEFGELFASAAQGLTSAQRELDQAALEQHEFFLLTDSSATAIPPIWFNFRQIEFELEIKTIVKPVGRSALLQCQLHNSTMANLFESGECLRSRIKIAIEPVTSFSFGIIESV